MNGMYAMVKVAETLKSSWGGYGFGAPTDRGYYVDGFSTVVPQPRPGVPGAARAVSGGTPFGRIKYMQEMALRGQPGYPTSPEAWRNIYTETDKWNATRGIPTIPVIGRDMQAPVGGVVGNAKAMGRAFKDYTGLSALATMLGTMSTIGGMPAASVLSGAAGLGPAALAALAIPATGAAAYGATRGVNALTGGAIDRVLGAPTSAAQNAYYGASSTAPSGQKLRGGYLPPPGARK